MSAAGRDHGRVSLPRVLASLLAGLLGGVSVVLLLMREETHFVRHALPPALIVAALTVALTWRSLRD
jgi:hypothetical protein